MRWLSDQAGEWWAIKGDLMAEDNSDSKNITNIANELRWILEEPRKRCLRTGRFIKTESPKSMAVNSERELNKICTEGIIILQREEN
jgi:hypothetical protein